MVKKIAQYLLHQTRGKGRHGIHSPFVYDFVTQVLPHRRSDTVNRIEALRRETAQRQDVVEIQDLGAGYGGHRKPVVQKRVSEVVRSSARGRQEGALLHRIVGHYRPKAGLELGTNLGFSTLYQVTAAPHSRWITIEGAPALADIALQHFARFGLTEVELVQGEFGSILEHGIDWAAFRPDYVLLDGNHRREPTLQYVEWLMPRVADGAMLVLDDIHWSAEMEQAWRTICTHPEVSVSMDLWHLGICTIRRPQAKEHFQIRF
jgi:predicted O-methyltransferase YrrM